MMVAGVLIMPLLAFGLTTTVASQSARAETKKSTTTTTTYTLGSGIESAKGDGAADKIDGDNGDATVKNIVNLMLWIVGVVSVIMLIFGSFRYVISNGDSTKVTAAKNTIMYAVIGLVLAIFAYAIVNFVIAGLGQTVETK
jgi:hypothetical protein